MSTGGPAAPVSAILYGKIHGRILSSGRLVQRDVYDLAVACLVDQGAVEETLALIPAEGKESGEGEPLEHRELPLAGRKLPGGDQ